MHYSIIRDYDVANGPGVRISLFVSGCSNKCKGCFQPETWDPEFGEEFTEETVNKIFELMDKPYIDGITILGGDPFYPPNREPVSVLISKIRDRYKDTKSIWVYTGYKLEELVSDMYTAIKDTIPISHILKNIDYLVDGKFELNKKDLRLQFRGSSNQRLIDMNATIITREKVKIFHKNKLDDDVYTINTVKMKTITNKCK